MLAQSKSKVTIVASQLLIRSPEGAGLSLHHSWSLPLPDPTSSTLLPRFYIRKLSITINPHPRRPQVLKTLPSPNMDQKKSKIHVQLDSK